MLPNDGVSFLKRLSKRAIPASDLEAKDCIFLDIFLNGADSLSTAENVVGIVKPSIVIIFYLIPFLLLVHLHTNIPAPCDLNYLNTF